MYATVTSRSTTPVTPDSVVGADININGSFADACSNDNREDCTSAADELLRSIILHESLPHYQLSPDYLHSSVLIPSTEKELGVSERCRRRTCEWMYDICDYFHLNREVVAIALFYVDRFFTLTSFPDAECNKQVPVTRKQFQLVALTGLYISIKVHGELRQGKSNQAQWSRSKFNVSVCASISRHQFTSQAIEKCEHLMLQTLDWRINPIVPSGLVIDTLVNYLSSGLDGSGNATGVSLYVYDCSKYLAELSVSVPALCMVYKPSVIAFASIMYSLDTYGTKLFSVQQRAEFECALHEASGQHFDTEKENIQSARGILQVICPNLNELFSPLTKEPPSPNSTKMSDSI
jgi:hypothetical protein